ncbi:hypothetical protein E4U21_002187 [Claviceps maximensis]|nr:hypothetical protein E4U21_002187 [Claviceps maximensis]
MGHKWKRHRSSPIADTGIDLLSTAFGMPSYWDIKRADRKLQDCDACQYEDDSDETINSILESDAKDACIPQETTSSIRSPAPKSKTWVQNSPQRRQQSFRHTTSPTEKQRNVLSKSKRNSVPVKGKSQDQNLKQSRCQPRERAKTSKPATPDSCSARLVESQGIPKKDARSYETITQLPFIMQPVGQFCQQNSSIHPQSAPIKAQSVVLPQIPQASYAGNSGFRYTYHYATPATTEKEKQMQSTPFPNSQTHTLLGLQQHVNTAQERLSNEPGNSRLQQDQRDAQQRLNKFMDVLVAEKTRGNLHSSNMVKGKEVTGKERHTLKDDMKENVIPNEAPIRSAPIRSDTSSSLPAQPQADQTLRLAVLRSSGQSSTMRHHLCSGCGEVRSQQFHENNPISAARSHKPILNYCSACRETRFNKNMMDRYHFCFGCGKVRSKVFQEKYKTKPGESLLPNYCGSCTNQVRLMEDNDEASILGAVIREPPLTEDHNADGVAAPGSLSASSKCDNSSPRQTMQMLKKSGKGKKIAQLRLSNKQSAKSTASPVSPAGSSPFYPGRRLGSAQRRAQRGSTPHTGEEHAVLSESLTENHEYRVPYVEEHPSDTETSESALEGAPANMDTLNREAKSTYQRETHLEESCEDEGQMLKPRHQYHEAGYDGLGPHSEQSWGTFSHSHPDINQEYTRATDVLGSSKKPLEEVKSVEEADEANGRRRSPLVDFERSKYSSYFHENRNRGSFQQDYLRTHEPETSQFSSSRGAFGRKDYYFNIFEYHSAGSGHSASTKKSLDLDGSNGHNTPRSSHYCGQAEGKSKSSSSVQENPEVSSISSSSSSSSSSSKAKSNNDHKPGMNSTYLRSVFTDFSRSTTNPYYNPRRRQHLSSSEGAFHGSWDWSRRKQPPPTTSGANRSTSFDDRIPEPIVEEPASAPSTPVQRTRLLEFKTLENSHPVLDLPPDLRHARPTHNQIDGNDPVPPVGGLETQMPSKRTVLTDC